VKRYVLDASAVMTFLDDRSGAAKVGELLLAAAEGGRSLLMSVVNWGEIYFVVWRGRGEAAAEETLSQIGRLPIEVIDVDMPTAKQAAALKATFGLPYADCFAAALAQQRKATLATADKDFARLQKSLSLLWAQV